MNTDVQILRDLAARYMAIASDPVQDRRRDLWRRHNSLQPTPTPVWVRAFAWQEMPARKLECADAFFHPYEDFFRRELFRAAFGDDYIIEPWIDVPAVHTCTGWGVEIERRYVDDARGSWKIDYPIKAPADIDRLRPPWHGIDEEATVRNVARMQEAVGDIITVNPDRGPHYRGFDADLSTHLGRLRGIENIMLDMSDRPEWLHGLLAFMRDGVLRCQEQAAQAGDWCLCDGMNQAAAYAEELPDPAPNACGTSRAQLWGYAAAQEYTLISPAMHDEFLLQYQLPILAKFGLVAYGCCEDYTQKIDMLRQIPNLRRIAVAPVADVKRCAEQIGTDYVISYRPSPTDMVGYGFDPDRIRRILRADLEACRGCCVDITLKDVETVEHDPDRIRKWVEVTRSVVEEV